MELPQRALSRRSVLKGGAAIGVGTAWVVPVVQGFSMTSAHAAVPSGLPTNPIITPTNPTETPSTSVVTPPVVRSIPSESVPSGTVTAGGGSGIDPITISSPASNSGSGSHGIDAQSISAATPKSSAQGLANTGPALPVGDALIYGVGAIAVGAVALAAGRQRKPAVPAVGEAEKRRPRPGPPRVPMHTG